MDRFKDPIPEHRALHSLAPTFSRSPEADAEFAEKIAKDEKFEAEDWAKAAARAEAKAKEEAKPRPARSWPGNRTNP